MLHTLIEYVFMPLLVVATVAMMVLMVAGITLVVLS
jgi:hypothetical protein